MSMGSSKFFEGDFEEPLKEASLFGIIRDNIGVVLLIGKELLREGGGWWWFELWCMVVDVVDDDEANGGENREKIKQ